MAALSDTIVAYLVVNNIAFSAGDFQTGQPEGQPDQVLTWNTEKLGAQPTQAQLDAAYTTYQNTIQAASVRMQRDAKLTACDWTQAVDCPLTNKATWATYRQALRDLPKETGFPWTMTWPTDPNGKT
jgi:polygalacturonase